MLSCVGSKSVFFFTFNRVDIQRDVQDCCETERLENNNNNISILKINGRALLFRYTGLKDDLECIRCVSYSTPVCSLSAFFRVYVFVSRFTLIFLFSDNTASCFLMPMPSVFSTYVPRRIVYCLSKPAMLLLLLSYLLVLLHVFEIVNKHHLDIALLYAYLSINTTAAVFFLSCNIPARVPPYTSLPFFPS